MKKLMIAAAAVAMIGGVQAANKPCIACGEVEDPVAPETFTEAQFYNVQFKLNTLAPKKIVCKDPDCSDCSDVAVFFEKGTRTIDGVIFNCFPCCDESEDASNFWRICLWEKAKKAYLTDTPVWVPAGTTTNTVKAWEATMTIKVWGAWDYLNREFPLIATDTVAVQVPDSEDMTRAQAISWAANRTSIQLGELLTTYYPGAERFELVSASAEQITVEETITTTTGFWNGDAVDFEDLFVRYGKKADKIAADWEGAYGSFEFRAAGIGTAALVKDEFGGTTVNYIKNVKGNFAGAIAPAQFKIFNGDECEWVDGKLLDLCDYFATWCDDGTNATEVPAYGTWQIKYNAGLKNKKMTSIIPAGYVAEGDDDDDQGL